MTSDLQDAKPLEHSSTSHPLMEIMGYADRLNEAGIQLVQANQMKAAMQAFSAALTILKTHDTLLPEEIRQAKDLFSTTMPCGNLLQALRENVSDHGIVVVKAHCLPSVSEHESVEHLNASAHLMSFTVSRLSVSRLPNIEDLIASAVFNMASTYLLSSRNTNMTPEMQAMHQEKALKLWELARSTFDASDDCKGLEFCALALRASIQLLQRMGRSGETLVLKARLHEIHEQLQLQECSSMEAAMAA